eukprot:6487632-Amphidinium_carterae.1
MTPLNITGSSANAGVDACTGEAHHAVRSSEQPAIGACILHRMAMASLYTLMTSSLSGTVGHRQVVGDGLKISIVFLAQMMVKGLLVDRHTSPVA